MVNSGEFWSAAGVVVAVFLAFMGAFGAFVRWQVLGMERACQADIKVLAQRVGGIESGMIRVEEKVDFLTEKLVEKGIEHRVDDGGGTG
jgi:hypothetical protein